jgi:hypothetical protein
LPPKSDTADQASTAPRQLIIEWTTSRRLDLHLPAFWPWASAWNLLWDNTTGPPASVAF